MKQQFLKAVADTIRLTVYDNNRPQIPASGTVALYKPDGGVLQTATAVSVDGTSGEMTYALTATHTADKGLNFKAVFAYVISGVTYYQTQLFDVVLSKLSIPITDDDLYNELETLRKGNYQDTQTATGGSASTLADTKRREADNFWKGGTISILSGTGANQQRDITAFALSNGIFTISPNWGTSPDNTSKYLAIRSFTKKIESAFEAFSTMIYNKGKRHSLILESTQITRPLIYLTIHMIALDLMDEVDDKWDRLSITYKEKFDNAFNTMKLDYDEDESGAITGEEEQQGPSEVRIGRA